jgi:hypothetical protein
MHEHHLEAEEEENLHCNAKVFRTSNVPERLEAYKIMIFQHGDVIFSLNVSENLAFKILHFRLSMLLLVYFVYLV